MQGAEGALHDGCRVQRHTTPRTALLLHDEPAPQGAGCRAQASQGEPTPHPSPSELPVPSQLVPSQPGPSQPGPSQLAPSHASRVVSEASGVSSQVQSAFARPHAHVHMQPCTHAATCIGVQPHTRMQPCTHAATCPSVRRLRVPSRRRWLAYSLTYLPAYRPTHLPTCLLAYSPNRTWSKAGVPTHSLTQAITHRRCRASTGCDAYGHVYMHMRIRFAGAEPPRAAGGWDCRRGRRCRGWRRGS